VSILITRRLVVAFSTIFLQKYLILNVYINLLGSIMIQLYLDNNPFSEKILNRLEKMNEFFTLLTCYSMILCSDFIDTEVKYTLGYWQIGL
jgi:hypothetical protein